jgi:hypothetical protein
MLPLRLYQIFGPLHFSIAAPNNKPMSFDQYRSFALPPYLTGLPFLVDIPQLPSIANPTRKDALRINVHFEKADSSLVTVVDAASTISELTS